MLTKRPQAFQFGYVVTAWTPRAGRGPPRTWARVRDAVAAGPSPCEISVGFTALSGAGSPAQALERADAALSMEKLARVAPGAA